MLNKLAVALQWRDDVASGEIIECSPRYFKTHLSVCPVSQDELEVICDAANTYYKGIGSALRISNYMGELRPSIAYTKGGNNGT